jgi:hypothetical protein
MLKLVAIPLLLASASALAETPPAYGTRDCRIGTLLPAPTGSKVSWSGACKDGFADGPGTLAWNDADDSQRRVEGTLARGAVTGEAKLTWESPAKNRFPDSARNSYIGTLRDGQPDGQGFFQYADGDMYEGGVVNGKPHGAGIRIDADRARYEGQWVDGKREGTGSALFALGGRYDGAWKNDRFEGAGTIVFAGKPRSWQGQFHEGRPVGIAAPALAKPNAYTVRGDYLAHDSKVMYEPVATTPFPPAASWSQLSPEHQNSFKTWYKALAPGDEPPYPLNGSQGAAKLVGKIRENFPYRGVFNIYVTVGADGKATSARAVGKVPQDIGRYASAFMLTERYKPAMCEGAPCEMTYAAGFMFH